MIKKNIISKNTELIAIIIISFAFCVLNLYFILYNYPSLHVGDEETYIKDYLVDQNIFIYLSVYGAALLFNLIIFNIFKHDIFNKTNLIYFIFTISIFCVILCVTPLVFSLAREKDMYYNHFTSPNYLGIKYSRVIDINQLFDLSNISPSYRQLIENQYKNQIYYFLLLRPGEILALSAVIFICKSKYRLNFILITLIYILLYLLCKDISMVIIFSIFLFFYDVYNFEKSKIKLKYIILNQIFIPVLLFVFDPLKLRYSLYYDDIKPKHFINHQLINGFNELKDYTIGWDYGEEYSAAAFTKKLFNFEWHPYYDYLAEYNELSFALKIKGLLLFSFILLLFIIYVFCLIKSLIKRLKTYKVTRSFSHMIACIFNIHLLSMTLFGVFFDITDFYAIEPVPFFGFPTLNYILYAFEIAYIYKTARLNTKYESELLE